MVNRVWKVRWRVVSKLEAQHIEKRRKPMKRFIALIVIATLGLVFTACPAPSPAELEYGEVFETPEPEDAVADIGFRDEGVQVEEELDPCKQILLGEIELNVETALNITNLVKDCDLHGEYFTIDGRIRQDPPTNRHLSVPGMNVSANLQRVAGTYVGVVRQFNGLPVMVRRTILRQTAPVVAGYVAEYVHPELLDEGLLSLDWEIDVATVNPEWFNGIDWPQEREERIDVEGYHEPISRVDLWIRMFWLRRGQAVLETMQREVQAVLDTADS